MALTDDNQCDAPVILEWHVREKIKIIVYNLHKE